MRIKRSLLTSKVLLTANTKPVDRGGKRKASIVGTYIHTVGKECQGGNIKRYWLIILFKNRL